MATAARQCRALASLASQSCDGLLGARCMATLPAALASQVATRSPGSIDLPADVNDALLAAAKGARKKHLRGQGAALTDELKHMSRSQHRGGVHPNLHGVPEAQAQRPMRGKARQQRRTLLAELAGEVPGLPMVGTLTGNRGPARMSRRARTAAEAAQEWEDLEEADEGGGMMDSTAAARPSELADAGPAELSDTVDTQGASGVAALDQPVIGPPAAKSESASQWAAPPPLPLDRPARSSAVAAGRRYGDEATALAYAATRMPACYAALRRALGEVAARQGAAWAPATMLDFGAGPGTAAWAARDAWPAAALRVTAVDASGAMAWLGRAVQAARTRSDAETGAASSVYWTARLGPASRRADLVTAGYVLGELDGDGERRRLVADLWARVAPGGVLLLVEPGTPAGSRAVAAARTQVLEAAADGEGSGAGQGRRAHVLAPCPHDGACPLEGAATWCHFVQRFQRGPLQRAAKDFAPGKVTVRSYADERFSYVAICKRPRPHGPPQPAIDAVIPLPNDVMEAYRALPPHEVPRRARPQLGLPEDIEGPEIVENPAAPAGPSGGAAGRMAWADDDAFLLRLAEGRGLLSDLDEDTLQLIRDSIGEDAELGTEDLELRRIGKGELGDEVTAADAPHSPADIRGSQRQTADSLPTSRPAPTVPASSSDGHDSDLDLETLAQASASTWSRVLRPPLKRGGHVVLDLCSAVESGARGEAVRQTVSRLGSERVLGGRGAYRLARGLGWGDLWPADYQDRLPLQRGGAWKKGE
ncbi:hypothetical protein ACKKBF_B03425 [Auxenochlorella protothecoides x Auxenochlorella symbiontica]